MHDHWLRQDGGEPSGGEGYLKLPSWYGVLWYGMVLYGGLPSEGRPLDGYLRLPPQRGTLALDHGFPPTVTVTKDYQGWLKVTWG